MTIEQIKLKSPYYERVQSWIKALRSGEYKKCNGTLKMQYTSESEAKFCVWGVGIDLQTKLDTDETTTVRWNGNAALEVGPEAMSGRFITGPPNSTKKHYGLSGLAAGYFNSRLISLNDSGRSFQEIADYMSERIVRDNS